VADVAAGGAGFGINGLVGAGLVPAQRQGNHKGCPYELSSIAASSKARLMLTVFVLG
jgi:hypothetical protein